MKKSKLFFTALFAISALNAISVSNVEAASTSTLSKQAQEAALKAGPEKMIRFSFKKYLYKRNYDNPQDVYAVRQHINNLYPNRSDLQTKACCALGECLVENNRCTKDQASCIVQFMMSLEGKR